MIVQNNSGSILIDSLKNYPILKSESSSTLDSTHFEPVLKIKIFDQNKNTVIQFFTGSFSICCDQNSSIALFKSCRV